MRLSCHSEYRHLKSVFINPVTAAFSDQAKLEKEWRSLNYPARPDFIAAKEEYDYFETLLKMEGAEVHYLQAEQPLTIDAIYCRDASIATDYGMILCQMGKPERISEPETQKTTFETHKIPVLGTITPPATLEGGDVAWLGKSTLLAGHCYRTNSEGIRQLKKLLAPFSIQVLVIDLPHYKGPTDVFHLMSIFSPVDKDLAVVYSPLMPIGFRNELLKRGFGLVEVPEDEFGSMGCNVLAIAPRKCIMVHGNPSTEAALKMAGCEVFTYKGKEISVKGGVGPTCLTRPLYRQL
jgi:N-dimethylarginine dimethylaminohydrolase